MRPMALWGLRTCLTSPFYPLAMQNLVSAYIDVGVAVAKLVAEDSGMNTAESGFMDNVRQAVTDVVNFERELAKVRTHDLTIGVDFTKLIVTYD